MELLVGVAIVTIIIGSVVTAVVLVLRIHFQSVASRGAAALEQETMESVRSVAEGKWTDLYNVSPKGATTTYRIITSSSTSSTSPVLTVASGTEEVVVNNITYTRFFSVENVNRDINGNIVTTGGFVEDPSTQKITVTVRWPISGQTAELKIAEYLTRSRSEVFRFTDWSGGVGVGGGAPPEQISCSAPSKPGELHISPADTSGRDCWAGQNTCLRLVLTPPTGNFQAEVKIDTLPPTGSGVYSYLGIIVSKDTSNFLRFELQANNAAGTWRVTAHKIISGVGSANVVSTSNLTNLLAPVYIRVNRTGDTWTLSYSTNGSTFTTVGSFSQALDLSAAGAKIGPNLGNTNGTSFAYGDFDYFRLDTGPAYSDEFNAGGPTADPKWSFITNDNSAYSVNSAPAGRTIVRVSPQGSGGFQNGGVLIVSNGSAAAAQLGPVGTFLPAGQYYVTLVSYDPHSEHAPQTQYKERWYVLLEASDGTDVATTRGISDLPDLFDNLQEVVVPNLSLSQDVVRATAIHAAYPDSGANSIRPICAAFDRISSPPKRQPSSLPWNNYAGIEDINASSTAGELSLVTGQLDGWLDSSTYDTGVPGGAAFNSIMWQGALGGGGTTVVKFWLAAANCLDGQSDPPVCSQGGWYTSTSGDGAQVGPDGTQATFYQPSGPGVPVTISSIHHKNKRFFRYTIFLERSSGATSPVVNDVIVNWSP